MTIWRNAKAKAKTSFKRLAKKFSKLKLIKQKSKSGS